MCSPLPSCLAVRIDNSSPLETQARVAGSKPQPLIPIGRRAYGPLGRPPVFFGDQTPASQGSCEFPKPEYQHQPNHSGAQGGASQIA
ncbi:hypothetical protein DSO57_1001634 [Entomophthora muscae]|uniref:Uncharacterized protein n=1 Tax=Entomophthora muscae TaxID=34485 RepID=A0ACC2S040_9FUNG|nr:hypothetical protein DSO57_1001634 [Entomophthora muscae]